MYLSQNKLFCYIHSNTVLFQIVNKIRRTLIIVAIDVIFCGRHFENGLKYATYKQIFAVNILFEINTYINTQQR